MRSKTPLIFMALLGLPWAGPAPAADGHIRLIAATCFNCHGSGGHSLGAVPSLAGRDRAQLQAAMLAQRAGEWETTVMRRYMNGYTPEEIGRLAEYFSNLK